MPLTEVERWAHDDNPMGLGLIGAAAAYAATPEGQKQTSSVVGAVTKAVTGGDSDNTKRRHTERYQKLVAKVQAGERLSTDQTNMLIKLGKELGRNWQKFFADGSGVPVSPALVGPPVAGAPGSALATSPLLTVGGAAPSSLVLLLGGAAVLGLLMLVSKRKK